MLPYLVAQKWFQHVLQANLLDQASIVAATTMGGDFGFSGELKNVEFEKIENVKDPVKARMPK